MMTVTKALKQGYVPTKIAVEVLMDPVTGNILYPCDGSHGKHGAAFDKYAIISDPVMEGAAKEDKAVNLVCKKHKKRYQKPTSPSLGGLIRLGAQIFLEKKWEKLSERKVKELRKKHGWFDWLFPEEE
jgi:hypothetical protein